MEALFEAAAGAMEADGNGVRGDPEDGPDLGLTQILPGNELQKLLIIRPEALEGGEGGRMRGARDDAVTANAEYLTGLRVSPT